MPTNVPDWLLERALVDEVPEAHKARLARALASNGDEDARARLAALANENAVILADAPPERVAAEIHRRLHQKAVEDAALLRKNQVHWAPRFVAGMAAAAAAAGAVVLLAYSTGERTRPAGGHEPAEVAGAGEIRLKGDPQLIIHRKHRDTVTQLGRGDSAKAGDLLQLSYVAGSASHGVILSIDGRGAVTVHFPEGDAVSGSGSSGTQGQQLDKRGAVQLAHSYELDDAPAFERFFFITANRPIDLAEVMRQAEALAAEPERARIAMLPLSGLAPHTQQSFLVTKESTP